MSIVFLVLKLFKFNKGLFLYFTNDPLFTHRVKIDYVCVSFLGVAINKSSSWVLLMMPGANGSIV